MLRGHLLLFSVLLLALSARAQRVAEDRYREVKSTVYRTHTRHSHTYLVYYVNGVRTRSSIDNCGCVEGAKYIIAYDTANPRKINTFNFTRPFFDSEEVQRETVARVVQTNFGHDLRYGRNRILWIKYRYYAPSPRKGKLKAYDGFLPLGPDVPFDSVGITGQYVKVVYSPENPDRSILHYTEKMDSVTAPGYNSQLASYELKTKYTEIVFPVGAFTFTTNSNYSGFTFHFNDPKSGTVASNTKPLFQPGRIYGGTLQLPYVSLYQRHGIITITPINFAVGNGDNVTYYHFGPSVGYQKQLTRQIRGNDYVLYPAVKVAAALNLSYSSLSYDLGQLNSANGQDISVDGHNVSSSFSATYARRAFRVAPEAGVYVRFSRMVELRFSTICNIEALHYENIRFYHSKSYNTNTRHLDQYLSDEHGNAISKDLLMPIPLITFRVECAIGGGH